MISVGAGKKFKKLMKQSVYRCAYIGCLSCLLLLAGCSASIPRIAVRGELMGQVVDTTVDSPIARYYLEHYLQRARMVPEYDRKIDRLYRQSDSAVLNRERLQFIAASFSVDFAALYLADRLWENAANRQLQTLFMRYVNEIKTRARKSRALLIPAASDYFVLFVPGWDYKKNGHLTGADFAVPRILMTELGLKNHLVEIPSNGSVEENARVLAGNILRHSREGKTMILVGASSAGPAIHLALGELLSPQQLHAVGAWVNLGGILQGTPLIDRFRRWPGSCLLQLAAWHEGWDKEAVLSMSAERGRERFQRLQLPPHILVFNYLGLALSGEISRYSRDRYPVLRRHGPNDGLALLADMITPGSMTIVALGSDHFFAEDPAIHIKTIALAQTVIHQLERNKAR